ncbi:hypothetical protein HKX48_004017 [Thoreauomyces humboldtii]|nr:hypothetical protein HKX48_004017 [Thoreauomyces humboldtii]
MVFARTSRNLFAYIAIVLAVLAPLCLAAKKSADERTDRTTGLVFSYEFPKTPFSHIVPGDKQEIRINVRNPGDYKQTVFAVSGFLSHQHNTTLAKRNLTLQRYKTVVVPHATVPINYSFIVESDGGDHGLVLFVDVTDEDGTSRRAVGYQGLVHIVESSSWFDFQSLSIYALFAAILGAVGYYSVQSLTGANDPAVRKKKAKRAAAATVTVVPESTVKPGEPDLDWIPQHLVDQKNGVRRTSSRSSKKGSSTAAK